MIRTPDIEKPGLRAGPITSRLLGNRKTKKLTRMMLLLRSTQRYRKVTLNPGYARYWQAGKGIGHIEGVEPAGEVVRRFAAALQEPVSGR